MKATSLGLKEVTVHFGAFDFEFVCIVGRYASAIKFVRYQHEWTRDWTDEMVAEELDRGRELLGRLFRCKGRVPIMWLPRAPRTAREYGTLAHETMHVVRDLMDFAGIDLSKATEEAYCHALGHGMTAILEGLRK